MKTDRISVNKTADQPEGVPIEIIVPETDLESNVLAHLLRGHLAQARASGRLPYKLPDQFTVEHQADGSFLVSGKVHDDDNPYYKPAQPMAIVGIRQLGGGFDIIHASLKTADKADDSDD